MQTSKHNVKKATINEARKLTKAIRDLSKIQTQPQIRDIKRRGNTVSFTITR